MTYEHILVDVEDGVAILTLNRPDKLNAMNRKLGIELHDAVKRAEADDGIGCIVITGAGDRAFSAGGDIKEQLSDDAKYTDEEMDEKRDNKRRYEISACLKPTIGMMNGLAYGGAAVLSSSLDMRIGCEATRFRFLAAAYGRINSTWTPRTRSAGRSRKSCCSLRASSRPRKRIASDSSIISSRVRNCARRQWKSRR
jgi:enoyl-CoA hydratase/carnithine racemase